MKMKLILASLITLLAVQPSFLQAGVAWVSLLNNTDETLNIVVTDAIGGQLESTTMTPNSTYQLSVYMEDIGSILINGTVISQCLVGTVQMPLSEASQGASTTIKIMKHGTTYALVCE